MFRFVKQIFVSAMFFGGNVSGVNLLNAVPKCISMNNQECKIQPEIININSKEPLFYPYSIKVNKCSGSCNNINDPYSKLFFIGTYKRPILALLILILALKQKFIEFNFIECNFIEYINGKY